MSSLEHPLGSLMCFLLLSKLISECRLCPDGWCLSSALCLHTGPEAGLLAPQAEPTAQSSEIWQIQCHLVHEADQPSYMWTVQCPEVIEAVRQFLSEKDTFSTLESDVHPSLVYGTHESSLTIGGKCFVQFGIKCSCPEISSGQRREIINCTTTRKPPSSPKRFPIRCRRLCFDTISEQVLQLGGFRLELYLSESAVTWALCQKHTRRQSIPFSNIHCKFFS